MASGFGSFTSSTTISNGATVNAVLSQSVDSTNRKVTVTLRMTAAYRRIASGSWTPGGGVAIWGSVNSGNYLNGNVGGTTGGLSGVNIGVSSVSGKTYTNGGVYTIPNGQIQVRSGYQGDKTISKTYNYDTSGSAITGSWSVEMYVPGLGSTKAKVSGSFTTDSITPAYTAPSGLYVSNISTTYNTITAKSTVTSWGTGVGPNKLETLALTQPYTQGGLPHRYVQTTSSSQTATVTNSSTAANGGITIKGAGNYYAGTYATNGSLDARATSGVVYTPPAPLASITYTQSQGSTNVTVTPKITGGSSSTNNGNNVSTSYRYSTNGGSTWSAWTTISGTATAWTEKTGSAFTCNYGASVKIQAKQTYQSKDSAVKEVSFTATTGTAPSGGTLTVDSSTWNSITLTAAGVNYGKPDGISGRKLSIGVSGSPSDLNYKRENQIENVTGATTTVTNSSIYPGASALNLKGMLAVYPYLWAWNTNLSTTTVHDAMPTYLPPAPGQLSYVFDNVDEYTVSYVGDTNNNISDYVAADLTRTVRYKIDNGAWTYIENDTVLPLITVTSDAITVPAQSTITAEAWMTYKGKTSSVSTFTATNANLPVHLYGSVNGMSKKIDHFYGGVYDENTSTYKSKKIKKLYASVNGLTKKIFEDLS